MLFPLGHTGRPGDLSWIAAGAIVAGVPGETPRQPYNRRRWGVVPVKSRRLLSLAAPVVCRRQVRAQL
jgi:hypothetical protein